jgi:diguanylate cyclase (GGDEF)-like protein
MAGDAGNHFSCALTAVLIDRVRAVAGEDGLARLLREAGSGRTLAYLEDLANWVSYDEMVALWKAGAAVTGDPELARHAGEDAVRRLGTSATSTMLRTLGSPEALIEKIGVASHRFSVVAKLEPVAVRPGLAEVRAFATEGFSRHPLHCQWTAGMLTQTSVLFGLAPARVEHTRCQAEGAPDCRYLLTWDPAPAVGESDPAAQVGILEKQLEAMSGRLQSVFATASDLIASGDLDETLARITDRAALQVRAPRYLLAVRPTPDSEIHCHQKGFDAEEAARVVEQLLSADPADLPDHWLLADVTSARNDYGRLVAMYQPGAHFFPQERELLEVYARYAASALDSATALLEAQALQREAQRRHDEARTLLELARRLASAGTTDQVARRLADAVPGVVDCDRVSVYIWQPESNELVRQAVGGARAGEQAGLVSLRPDDAPQLAAWLRRPGPEPFFIDLETSAVRDTLRGLGAVASVAVPISTSERFLGFFVVSVFSGPERLAPSPELLDRLSGVAAHAVSALENGRLVDHITHQARHDALTGLANRAGFGERLSLATGRARSDSAPLALFYIDLDDFKPVNDRYGHGVGDELLCAVGSRLLGCVRGGDTVARLGGDEFAVLVEGVEDAGDVERIAGRLEEAFASPFSAGGASLSVGASIGRAMWPAEVSDLDALLRHADAAMYAVKHARAA